jgi:hypothetical protein
MFIETDFIKQEHIFKCEVSVKIGVSKAFSNNQLLPFPQNKENPEVIGNVF